MVGLPWSWKRRAKSKELLFAHRYAEAVEAYRSELLKNPGQNLYPGLGQALLGIERYAEALTAFRQANEIEHRRLAGNVPCVNEAAAALWLLGDRDRAIHEWRLAVEGILGGTIAYGDAAGGARQGLLLWYGAVTMRNVAQREFAYGYLRSLMAKKVYGSATAWPSPIVAMVTRDASLEQALEAAAKSRDLGSCLQRARTDPLLRRRLSQLLFYSACRERESGREDACVDIMRTCCKLANPVIEIEWYLARHECRAQDASA